MPVNEYYRVPDEDYKKIAQLEYALEEDTCCEDETFENLLAKNSFNLNYQLPETGLFQVKNVPGLIGGTIFHASIIYLQSSRIESFIKRGIDITIKNADGYTVVHLAVKREYEQYLHSWKNEFSPFIIRDFCSQPSSILSAHISFNIITNPCDNNGISHFHIACMVNNLEVVKFFLQNGLSIHETVNQDSPIMPGFTPLHFAAKFCAVEVVEELLKHDADMHFKDAKGMSSLHVLIDERLKILLRMKRASGSEAHYSHLHEYLDKNKKIILTLLEKIPPNFVDSTGFTSLHAISTLDDTSIAKKFFNENDSMNLNKTLEQNSTLCSGYTALHFASHFSNANMVLLLLKKGANMRIRDAKGATAFDNCLQNLSLKVIHNIIMHEPQLENITFSDGKTKLSQFISSMQQPKKFADFLKNANICVPSNSPFCAGNTPLHFAVICSEIPIVHWDSEYSDGLPSPIFPTATSIAETNDYLEKIKVCLDLNADVTSTNERRFTPLHLAFRSQANRAVQLMLQYHKKSINPIDLDGLSHLHVASAEKNHVVVEKLLSNGADANGTTKSSFIVRPHFMTKGSTPLHFAAVFKSPRVVKALIENRAEVLAKDSEGATPLERFYGIRSFGEVKDFRFLRYRRYSNDDCAILQLLLPRMAMEIVNRQESPNILLDCYRIVDNSVVQCIAEYEYDTHENVFENVGITKLHVACVLGDVRKVKKLISKGSNIDAQVSMDSPLWAGCTPLHVAVEIENNDVVALLLGLGADVTLQNGEHDTPVHAAFNTYRYRKKENGHVNVDAILNSLKNYNVNPVDVGGISHFHIACARNATVAVNKFLEHGVDIDQVTDYFEHPYRGFTALHFAAHHLQAETIKILIRNGADLHFRNTAGNNLLHTCFNIFPLRDENRTIMKLKRENLLDILIKAGVDVNEKNIFGETIFRLLMKENDFTLEDLQNYFNRGCHVNVYDIDGEGLMAVLLKKMKQFDEYLKLFERTDIKNPDESGRNAIHNVVSFKLPDRVFPIEDAFIPIKDYTTVIGKLICLGFDIEHRDQQGLTPLDTAAKMQNITGIIGLLNNGADINVLDQNGNTAVDYSFDIAAKSKGEKIRELDQHILKVFVEHIHKLEAFGLEIIDRNREVLKKVQQLHSFEISMGEEFHKEITLLKECRFGSHDVTLYDFLSETAAVVSYKNMPKGQRLAIDEFFKAENLRKSYPVLSGIMLLQYKKALCRV